MPVFLIPIAAAAAEAASAAAATVSAVASAAASAASAVGSAVSAAAGAVGDAIGGVAASAAEGAASVGEGAATVGADAGSTTAEVGGSSILRGAGNIAQNVVKGAKNADRINNDINNVTNFGNQNSPDTQGNPDVHSAIAGTGGGPILGSPVLMSAHQIMDSSSGPQAMPPAASLQKMQEMQQIASLPSAEVDDQLTLPMPSSGRMRI